MATPAEVNLDSAELKKRIDRFHAVRDSILAQVREVIVGQEEVLDQILTALFVGGHCLITGLARHREDADGPHHRANARPRLQAHSVHAGPDALRHHRHGHHRGRSHHRPSPLDVRARARSSAISCWPTKSTARRPRRSRRCSKPCRSFPAPCAAITTRCPSPFFVLATQNPIELEGTYPLPEAQLDRFLFNTVLDYLSAEDEVKVVDLTTTTRVAQVQAVTNAEEILDFQQLVRMVPIAESLARYVVDLVRATRHNSGDAPDFVKKYVNYGAQRARRAVHRARGQGARARARPLPRRLRRHHVAGDSRAAPSHPAEFPRGIGSHRFGRNPAALASGDAAAGGSLTVQRFLDPAVLARHFGARPGRQDGGGRLRRRPASLAGFRLQPGVRRIPRLHAGRRSAPRRLERLRAHRARLPEALSRRNQQPAHRAARREQFHELFLARRHQNGLRALHRRLAFLSRDPESARCRRPDRLRRRSAQLHPAVHAPGTAPPPARRSRARRAARPHRFRQAAASFPGISCAAAASC